MHVLHVTPYFAPAFRYGGPPRTILGLCTALRAAGVDVEVVTTAANGDAPLPASGADGDVYDGIRVHYAAPAFPRRYFGAALDGPLRSALQRADVCHIHGIWNAPEWLASKRARDARKPYVISTRGMLLPAAAARNRWRKAVMFGWVERRNLTGAARLHSTSPEETASLDAIVNRDRIVEIPNGVDVCAAGPRRSGVRARLGIPEDAPVVLFLGRIHPIKRLDLLASAVARVRERDAGVHLVIAGPDEGSHLSTLAPFIAPLGSSVHVIGAVDEEKWQLLAESTLLAMTSDSESFGMSVVEAMAAGVPVVVARTCGWSTIDADGCGVLVDQRADAIAAGIERVLRDRAAATAMGARGARLARERFDWRVIAGRMIACYESVLG